MIKFWSNKTIRAKDRVIKKKMVVIIRLSIENCNIWLLLKQASWSKIVLRRINKELFSKGVIKKV